MSSSTLIKRKYLSQNTSKFTILLITIAILMFNINFIKIYYNYIYEIILKINVQNDYFPAGDDTPYHIWYTKEVIVNPISAIISPMHTYDHYPSIFHLIIALLRFLTGNDYYNIFALYGILLLIIGPTLYSFVFAKFGQSSFIKYTIFLSLLFIFIAFSLRIFHLLNDGNYPELTVALIFIPLLILLITKYFETSKLVYFYLVPTVVAISININLLGGVYALILYIIFIFIYVVSSYKNLKIRLLYALSSFILLLFVWISIGPYRFSRIMNFLLFSIANKSDLLPSAITHKITFSELSYYMFLNEKTCFLFILIIISSSFYYLILLIRKRITYREQSLLIINLFVIVLLLMTYFFNFLRIARYEALLLPFTSFTNALVILITIIRYAFNDKKFFSILITFFVILFLEINIYTFANLRIEDISNIISISHRIDQNKYVIYNYLIKYYSNSTILVIHPLDIWLYALYDHTKVLWPYPYVLRWVAPDDPKVPFYKNITQTLLLTRFKDLNLRYGIDLIVISLPYESQWYHDFVAPFLDLLRNVTENVQISRLRIFLYSQIEPGDALISNIRVVDDRVMVNISKVFWITHVKEYKNNNESIVYVLGFPKNTVISFRRVEPYKIGEKLYSYVVESNYTQVHIKPGIYYVETNIILDNKHNNHSIELLVFIFPNSYNGEPLFTYVFVLRPEIYSGFS